MSLRRPAAIAFAVGLVVVVAGIAGLLLSRHSTPAMRPAAAGVGALPAPTAPIVAPPQSASPKPVSKPVSLTIPLIAVKTNLVTLGLTSSGALQVPSTTMVAGWYTGSPRPGSIGSAIIVGHIDNQSGPGVFFRLSTLRKGDQIYVQRADGTTVMFRVTRVQLSLKDHFPTEAVYGPTPDAELRLITCGGVFDPATHHYLSNIVVYATESALRSCGESLEAAGPPPRAGRDEGEGFGYFCCKTCRYSPHRRSRFAGVRDGAPHRLYGVLGFIADREHFKSSGLSIPIGSCQRVFTKHLRVTSRLTGRLRGRVVVGLRPLPRSSGQAGTCPGHHGHHLPGHRLHQPGSPQLRPERLPGG
jgi:sortase (surface protein transpeptidase)